MNKKAFGKALKKCREEKNITQKELASMLSAVPQTISSWECGQSYPDLESVEALCKVLDIKEQDLFEKTRELEAQEEKGHLKSIVVGVVSTVVAVSLLVGGIFLMSHSGSDKKGAALIATEADGIPEQLTNSQIYTLMNSALETTKDLQNLIPAGTVFIIERKDDFISLSVEKSLNDEEVLKSWKMDSDITGDVIVATDKTEFVECVYVGTVQPSASILWESEIDKELVNAVNIEQAEVLIDKDAAFTKIKTLLGECVASGPGYSSNPFDYMDNDAYKELKSMGENVLPLISELHEHGNFEGLEDYIAVYLLLDISGMGDLDKIPEKYKADADDLYMVTSILYNYWKRTYEYTHHFSAIDKLYNTIKAPEASKILRMPEGDIDTIISEWNRKKLGGSIGQCFTDDENYYMIQINFTFMLDLEPSKEQSANMACDILEELEGKGISAFYDATDGCAYMYIHAGDFKRLDLKSAPDCLYSWY